MSHPDDEDEQFRVADGVNDAIAAGPDTVPTLLTGELLATRRPRVIHQRMDAGHDALPILPLINGLDFLGRGRLDEDPISCHAS